MSTAKEESVHLELAQRITTNLGGAAGVLLIVYAIGYILGFRYLSEYFSDIGAPWALGMLGPVDIIQAPSSFAAVALAIGLQLWIYPEIVKNATLGFSKTNGIIAIALTAIHYAVLKFMHGYNSYWIFFAAIFGAISAVTLAGYLFKISTERRGTFLGAMSFLGLMLVITFVGIPTLSDSKARIKIEAIREGKFPIKINGDRGGNWQLVRAMPNNQLLIAKAGDGKKMTFRLIPATDAIEIESTK